MRISQIKNAMVCGNLYNINRLSLGSEKLEKASALSNAMKYIINGYTKGVYSDMEQWMIDHYKREWFNSTIEFKEAFASDKKYLKRFQDYVMETWKGEVVKDNIRYSIPVDFEINGIKGDKISGKIDYLIRHKDSTYEAVILNYKKTAATYRARKPQNVVENQLELICAKLFLMSDYPDVKISSYHAVGREDKKGQLKAFEEKKGYNIVAADFSEDAPLLTERLMNVLALRDETDCQNCYQRELCMSGRYSFRFPETEETEDVPKRAAVMTEIQEKVSLHQEGIMNVIAVPGAGKTFTLVQRVKNLIKKGVNPSHILLITFTRKACAELKERITAELGEEGDFPVIETFNSWGYKIIRENPQFFGKRKLAGDVDKNSIILSLLGGAPRIKGVSYEMLYGRFGLVRRISRWFSEIDEIGEEEFVSLHQDKLDVKAVVYLYRLYKMQFANAGYIEYDDQITLVCRLFENHPEIAELYAKKHRYIMVDEYQDVNREQVSMLKHLVRYNHNLLVVGDDDQSIYAFRGADSSYMLNFQNMFPDAKTVIMADNFRSNDKIIAAADAVICRNADRYEKKFIAHSEAKNKPIFVKEGGRETVGYYIRQLLKKYKPGEIAVLARNNKELFQLEQYLSGFVKVSAPKDYVIDDAVFVLIKNILQIYVCGLNNPAADKAVFSLFSSSGMTMPELEEDAGKSFYERLVSRQMVPPLDIHDIHTADHFKKEHLTPAEEIALKLFQSLKKLQYSVTVEEALSQILGIWDISGRTKHPVIDILKQQMEERQMRTLHELYNHMQNMIAFEDTTRVGYDASEDAVNLLTAHDSKGKEFPVVLIYGTNDFNISDVESDDRRLLYVAMTRAKNTLIMLQFSGQNNGLFEEIADFVIAA